jgi:hypothetical protein
MRELFGQISVNDDQKQYNVFKRMPPYMEGSIRSYHMRTELALYLPKCFGIVLNFVQIEENLAPIFESEWLGCR